MKMIVVVAVVAACAGSVQAADPAQRADDPGVFAQAEQAVNAAKLSQEAVQARAAAETEGTTSSDSGDCYSKYLKLSWQLAPNHFWFGRVSKAVVAVCAGSTPERSGDCYVKNLAIGVGLEPSSMWFWKLSDDVLKVCLSPDPEKTGGCYAKALKAGRDVEPSGLYFGETSGRAVQACL